LSERDAQAVLGQIAVLDVDRGADNRNIPRFEFGQKFRFKNISAPAFLVQIHRQIEMEVDNPFGLQPLDSFFSRLLNSSHSVAVAYER